jgi:hypothetical protein
LSLIIGESYCFPRFRIGEAMGGFSGKSRDVWWTVVESEVQTDLDGAVESALYERGLPILDRLVSVDSVYRFVRDVAPPRYAHPYTRICQAIVCHLHGDVSQAESLLIGLEANRRVSNEWRVRIKDVRGRLASINKVE